MCQALVTDRTAQLFVPTEEQTAVAADAAPGASTSKAADAAPAGGSQKKDEGHHLPLSSWIVRQSLVDASMFVNDTFSNMINIDADFAKFDQVRSRCVLFIMRNCRNRRRPSCPTWRACCR